jgi:hypothetical protein
MSKEIISHGRSDPKVEEQNTQCHCNPTKIAVCKLRGEVGKQKKIRSKWDTHTQENAHTHTHRRGQDMIDGSHDRFPKSFDGV